MSPLLNVGKVFLGLGRSGLRAVRFLKKCFGTETAPRIAFHFRAGADVASVAKQIRVEPSQHGQYPEEFFIDLANQPPVAVSAAHQTWLRFKPAELALPDATREEARFEKNFSDRLTIIEAVSSGFTNEGGILTDSAIIAYLIDGHLFVI
jgi:hypothetical protein